MLTFKRIVFISLIGLFFACNQNPKYKPSKISNYDTIRYKVYQVDSGWGYDILVNSKVFIHQPFIPGVQGRFVFQTSSDASKTALLIIHKLLTQPGLPAVSVEELDSLGVLYDTVKKFQQYLLQKRKRYIKR